ncbi:CoA-binding protein [Deinococcus peraridilitoris]|uniref:Putative CoA-binding protein n=1 Tax=Deinococcus peraridilitoris (strain DSM 19664 / LMG 22246 / CIP 109416 / KR-200) TaxID=937777 RepID=L0A0S4_DEIPD|nr:CoA-binding protein [Deinococcus peraridilitoris]AFZ66590.1 putative CoA-binding protein [Deinococcus peraridilitoris DSM 19664]
MKELTTIPEIVQVLEESKVVAVVGFHRDPMKPAHYVPEYLSRQGYSVIPVNPTLAARGESFFGCKAVATLADIHEHVDVVEVFRRSDKVSEHLNDILSMRPLPKTVWMQQGIENREVADALIKAGIQVVQNRCMLADHRHYC